MARKEVEGTSVPNQQHQRKVRKVIWVFDGEKLGVLPGGKKTLYKKIVTSGESYFRGTT